MPISIYDEASFEAALRSISDPELTTLLRQRHDQWRSAGLVEMTHLLVIQPGDTELALLDEVGFSPLVNPIDGERFGSGAFQPYWDWIGKVGTYWLLIVSVGDSGFAYELLIQDQVGVEPALRAMCQEYAA